MTFSRCVLALAVAVAVASAADTQYAALLLGDWGGQPTSPYTEPGQVSCAKVGMPIVAKAINAESVWLLGDNFYDTGVKSVNDPRFQTTFENVYTDPSILNIPYYVVVGNHDHGGNTSAQIDYSSKSKRWTFPALWYTKTFSFNGGATTIDAVFIDTVVLAGNSDDLEDQFGELPGPADPKLAATQWDFIEGALNSSKANYLLVVGHYPVWSAGEHGPTTVLVNQLKPMLEKYHAHYICGHDHDLEFIDEGKGPKYVLVGAGDNCCYSNSHASAIPAGSLKFGVFSGISGGFGSFVATSKSMTVNWYSSNGTTLYTTQILPRA